MGSMLHSKHQTEEKMRRKSRALGTWKRAHKEDDDMGRFFPTAVWLMLAIASPAVAQEPVGDRAVAASRRVQTFDLDVFLGCATTRFPISPRSGKSSPA